ncbi:MAG: hypothetical protein ACM31D_14815 [Bacteroidota bacterium]
MKRIRIHGADHMRAALIAARDTGRAVVLVSPQAGLAGIGWWRRLMAQAATEFPDVMFESVLDCGPSAGMALAAIRTKVGPLQVSVTPDVLAKLSDIAQQAGIRAEGGGNHALDLLGMPEASRACRDWLAAEDADTGA